MTEWLNWTVTGFSYRSAHFTELTSYLDKRCPALGPMLLASPALALLQLFPFLRCEKFIVPWSHAHLNTNSTNFLDHRWGIRMLKFFASSPFSKCVQASSPGLSSWGLITRLLYMVLAWGETKWIGCRQCLNVQADVHECVWGSGRERR